MLPRSLSAKLYRAPTSRHGRPWSSWICSTNCNNGSTRLSATTRYPAHSILSIATNLGKLEKWPHWSTLSVRCLPLLGWLRRPCIHHIQRSQRPCASCRHYSGSCSQCNHSFTDDYVLERKEAEEGIEEMQYGSSTNRNAIYTI